MKRWNRNGRSCKLKNYRKVSTLLTTFFFLKQKIFSHSKISSMDICIIDEATQCNEPTSLIPLQFGVKSLILVGDTKQLPSTVLSEVNVFLKICENVDQGVSEYRSTFGMDGFVGLCYVNL